MYRVYPTYPSPYYYPIPMNQPYVYQPYPSPYWVQAPMYKNSSFSKPLPKLKDYGPHPFVVNIEEATKRNNTFRTALWTGEYLQVTLMSIKPGEDIGLERHPTVDQFIRIEEGHGVVQMGDRKQKLDFQEKVHDDDAIMIPAGKWHNVINTGNKPLKLYSIYAPPEHPRGTVHKTKADAEASEVK
ncbi:cupin domain-containing protein [Bacillus sp. FJAT-47783]|uniref:cupin domain-containing protein n=1 Tax=Bacillus sp. FJAT-47783 TaxID=2922712 RepID=UPI001FADB2B7|nr:cupin domain-containing protein [Bacillus sp. FJAT-47783]